MKLKDACSLEEKYDQAWKHIKKQRYYFANKGLSSQSYGFSSSHEWMWELDHKCWALKNDAERLLLNHAKTPGFLAPGGEEFNLGPETRLDGSELLCNKVLLKYKGDRESFWHRHQKRAEKVPAC